MTALEAVTAAGGYVHPIPSPDLVARAVVTDAREGELPLEACYRVCRDVAAAHGRTYHLATRFLPAERRRHVYALYAFARYADDIVDHAALAWAPQRRRAELDAWSEAALAGLIGGPTDDPVLRAAARTVSELGIAHDDLRAFLQSMAMDLSVDRYSTYADLADYMHGSAAVIGTMMLPVLGGDPVRARGPAMDLGVAFQLTNFLRDVAEDWDRGRIYLPLEDLERFGVTEWDFRARHVGPAFRRMLAFQADRARALYRRAEDGWTLLPPASARCIRVAHRLYAGILDSLERCDYQVFRVRASVPRVRRLAVVAGAISRGAWSTPGAWTRGQGEPSAGVGHNGRGRADVRTWPLRAAVPPSRSPEPDHAGRRPRSAPSARWKR